MSQMFRQHYNLSVQPFGVTPDPAFLYFSPTHREAMASLMYGIQSFTGFTALIATPGMGKTTLLFNLLHMLKGMAQTAFLFQTLCSPEEFLHALLSDLGIADDGKNMAQMHAKLNEYLVRESKNGRQVVVIIDESQNLSEPVFEVVRMLSNFETPHRKLLHVILAGQPQLADKLTLTSLTQLRQRISIVARLAPLNAQETKEYIEHRLRVAGYSSSAPLFTDQAYAIIAEQSGGIPRNINNLCFNSMSLGCALKSQVVDESMVHETITDLDLTTISASPQKTEEQSPSLSPQAPDLDFTPKGRIQALFAVVTLIVLVWLFFQLGNGKSANGQQQTASTSASALGLDESGILAGSPDHQHEFAERANQNTQTTRLLGAPRVDHQANTAEVDPLLREIEHWQRSKLQQIPLIYRAVGETQFAPEVVAPFEFAQQRHTP
jgi:general secretion pathway protein A